MKRKAGILIILIITIISFSKIGMNIHVEKSSYIFFTEKYIITLNEMDEDENKKYIVLKKYNRITNDQISEKKIELGYMRLPIVGTKVYINSAIMYDNEIYIFRISKSNDRSEILVYDPENENIKSIELGKYGYPQGGLQQKNGYIILIVGYLENLEKRDLIVIKNKKIIIKEKLEGTNNELEEIIHEENNKLYFLILGHDISNPVTALFRFLTGSFNYILTIVQLDLNDEGKSEIYFKKVHSGNLIPSEVINIDGKIYVVNYDKTKEKLILVSIDEEKGKEINLKIEKELLAKTGKIKNKELYIDAIGERYVICQEIYGEKQNISKIYLLNNKLETEKITTEFLNKSRINFENLNNKIYIYYREGNKFIFYIIEKNKMKKEKINNVVKIYNDGKTLHVITNENEKIKGIEM